jgi:hypothetical protein
MPRNGRRNAASGCAPAPIPDTMQTTFDYRGKPVMVSRTSGGWELRAHGNVYGSRFLYDAVAAGLPSLTARERDGLVIWLLEQETQAA